MPSSIDNKVEEDASRAHLHDDIRWQLAMRISESVTFSRSSRLSHLLLYLCEEQILGRGARLNELQIAADVFGRKTNFDPAADTIVRSHMLRLRQKLEAYFENERANEPLKISVPKGSYVPVFENAPIEDVATTHEPPVITATPMVPETVGIDTLQLMRIQHRILVACAALSFLCVLLLAFLIVKRPLWQRGNISGHSTRHQLWKGLFGSRAGTMLVAADSGLVMLHGATNHNSTLEEYLARDFHREIVDVEGMQPEAALSIANRRYTSFVDLEFFDRLTHLPEALESSYTIRYARDISVNDLKSSNVILSGSQDANPWIELFEPQMNFVLHDDLAHNLRAFSDREPTPQEHTLYVCDHYEYGVLAYLPNLGNAGNVLLVEGTSVAGTQAISDFLFIDKSLDSFLAKIARPDGSIPHFEVLLQSENLNGSASQSEVVAYRVH
jgi:hypothetical protein